MPRSAAASEYAVDGGRGLHDVVELAKGQLAGCDRRGDLLWLYAGPLERPHRSHAVDVARSTRFFRSGRREDPQLDKMLQSVLCRACSIGQLIPRETPASGRLGSRLNGCH